MYVVCAHIVPVCWNTYAAPLPGSVTSDWRPLMPVALLASPGEPTTSVSPSIATLVPNAYPVPPFDAWSTASGAHVVPERRNT
jgi:hypothetical protein